MRAAVLQFDDAGFLLDGRHTADGVLDDYELRRWDRNLNFFGSYASMGQSRYELQARLRDCRITLIGLGGIGSHLLPNLAAMGVGHVRAVEADLVDLSNLNRQLLYRDADVGRAKLDLAVERVREFDPRIDIEPISLRIGSVEDVHRLADGADLLISVSDRADTEVIPWVNAGCAQAGIPFVCGAIDTQRALCFTIVPGRTGCVECWRLTALQNDPTSVALHEHRRDRRLGGDNAAFAPLVMLAAGFILNEVTRVVTGIGKPVAAGRLMQLRFDEVVEAERWGKHPGCPVCGLPVSEPAERPLTATTAL
ncbi:MAG TPA: ThiF family adenylyltransferase [Jatrophihabitans sp.]|nr:ThiF family adenylyltransferase [Jatrophihabitans sp.]